MTHILTALGLESRWRARAHGAESGAWDRPAVARETWRVMARARPARGDRDPPVAWDDPTRHRTSAKVWGTGTVPEASARHPHRAATVRAHPWVVRGDWVPGTPWLSLPQSARLSGRPSQWPPGATLHPKTAWAVERWRQADAESTAPLLGVFAGADAVATVVAPWVHPGPERRRRESLTRRRGEARWSQPVVARPQRQGRRPPWGARSAAPPPHVDGAASWRPGRAWVEGRIRRCRDTPGRGRWAVRGPHLPSPGCGVEVPGDREPWCRVTTALELSAAHVVDACAARGRQADGCRDHQPRRGLEACRAWTQAPGRRTCQVQRVALTWRRRRPCRLDHTWGVGSWWSTPAWSAQTRPASIRDLCRLFWRHRTGCSPLLVALEAPETPCQVPALQGNGVSRAA